MNASIRYGFAPEPLFRKGSFVFGVFKNSLRTRNDSVSQLNNRYSSCDDDELHKINAKEIRF